MPDIVLLNGSTDSAWIDWGTIMFDAESVTLMSPSGLEANTYTFQVSDTALGTNSYTLQDPTTAAIKFPAAGIAIVYNGILVGFNGLRIHSSVAVGADRTIKVFKSFRA